MLSQYIYKLIPQHKYKQIYKKKKKKSNYIRIWQTCITNACFRWMSFSMVLLLLAAWLSIISYRQHFSAKSLKKIKCFWVKPETATNLPMTPPQKNKEKKTLCSQQVKMQLKKKRKKEVPWQQYWYLKFEACREKKSLSILCAWQKELGF